MDFLTFLLYFFCSMIIFNLFRMGLSYLIYSYRKYKFHKDVASGKIKLVSFEEAFGGTQNDDGDKTWN